MIILLSRLKSGFDEACYKFGELWQSPFLREDLIELDVDKLNVASKGGLFYYFV
jgi:hypothetical protein